MSPLEQEEQESPCLEEQRRLGRSLVRREVAEVVVLIFLRFTQEALVLLVEVVREMKEGGQRVGQAMRGGIPEVRARPLRQRLEGVVEGVKTQRVETERLSKVVAEGRDLHTRLEE